MSTEAPPATVASTADIDRYCELTLELWLRSDEFFGVGDLSPIAVERYMVYSEASLIEMYEVADPSIQEHLVPIVDQAQLANSVMAANDYDALAGFEDLSELPDIPHLHEAARVVDSYDEEFCGLAADGPVTETAEETGSADPIGRLSIEKAELIVEGVKTPEGLEFVLAEFTVGLPDVSAEQAECFVSRLTAEQWVATSSLAGLDRDDVDRTDPGVQEVLAVMDACGVSLIAMMPDPG